MKKHFGRFIVLSAVLVGAYFLLNRETVSSYTIPFIEVRTGEIAEKLSGLTGGIKKYAGGQATVAVSELADDFVSSVSEKGGQLTRQIFDGAKNNAFNFFRQAVSEKVDSVGANLGIDVQQIGKEITPSEQESPIIFGIQAGSPAYFTIKNRELEKISYEVDWRDGNKKNGDVSVKKSVTVSRIWSSPGEYYPRFKIITSRGEKIHEIAISVISL